MGRGSACRWPSCHLGLCLLLAQHPLHEVGEAEGAPDPHSAPQGWLWTPGERRGRLQPFSARSQTEASVWRWVPLQSSGRGLARRGGRGSRPLRSGTVCSRSSSPTAQSGPSRPLLQAPAARAAAALTHLRRSPRQARAPRSVLRAPGPDPPPLSTASGMAGPPSRRAVRRLAGRPEVGWRPGPQAGPGGGSAPGGALRSFPVPRKAGRGAWAPSGCFSVRQGRADGGRLLPERLAGEGDERLVISKLRSGAGGMELTRRVRGAPPHTRSPWVRASPPGRRRGHWGWRRGGGQCLVVRKPVPGSLSRMR